MKFTERQLESAIIELLDEQGFSYISGEAISRKPSDVLIKKDLRAYLAKQYKAANITSGEIDSIIHQLETLPASDLYESNKTFCKWLSDDVLQKQEQKQEQKQNSQSSPKFFIGDLVWVRRFLLRKYGNDRGQQTKPTLNKQPSMSHYHYA